jgi:O-antigen ligase
LGVVGLLFCLGFFLTGMKLGWGLYRTNQEPFLKALGLGLVMATMACLVANFFGFFWNYLSVMGFYWILLALVLRANSIERKGVEKKSIEQVHPVPMFASTNVSSPFWRELNPKPAI